MNSSGCCLMMFCLDCFGSGDDRRRDLIGSELESLREDLRRAMLTISALSASLDEERSNSARLAKHIGASHIGASSNAVLQKGPPAAAARRENQENITQPTGGVVHLATESQVCVHSTCADHDHSMCPHSLTRLISF